MPAVALGKHCPLISPHSTPLHPAPSLTWSGPECAPLPSGHTETRTSFYRYRTRYCIVFNLYCSVIVGTRWTLIVMKSIHKVSLAGSFLPSGRAGGGAGVEAVGFCSHSAAYHPPPGQHTSAARPRSLVIFLTWHPVCPAAPHTTQPG